MTAKVGYLGLLDGVKKETPPIKRTRTKSFALTYDLEKPMLYSHAEVTICGKTIATNRAIWDTGATISALSKRMEEKVGALPDEEGIMHGATGNSDSNIYCATVELPGGIVFRDVDMWGIGLPGLDVDVVIGMDIISRGKLVVETVGGVPMFSFSVEQED